MDRGGRPTPSARPSPPRLAPPRPPPPAQIRGRRGQPLCRGGPGGARSRKVAAAARADRLRPRAWSPLLSHTELPICIEAVWARRCLQTSPERATCTQEGKPSASERVERAPCKHYTPSTNFEFVVCVVLTRRRQRQRPHPRSGSYPPESVARRSQDPAPRSLLASAGGDWLRRAAPPHARRVSEAERERSRREGSASALRLDATGGVPLVGSRPQATGRGVEGTGTLWSSCGNCTSGFHFRVAGCAVTPGADHVLAPGESAEIFGGVVGGNGIASTKSVHTGNTLCRTVGHFALKDALPSPSLANKFKNFISFKN